MPVFGVPTCSRTRRAHRSPPFPLLQQQAQGERRGRRRRADPSTPGAGDGQQAVGIALDRVASRPPASRARVRRTRSPTRHQVGRHRERRSDRRERAAPARGAAARPALARACDQRPAPAPTRRAEIGRVGGDRRRTPRRAPRARRPGAAARRDRARSRPGRGPPRRPSGRAVPDQVGPPGAGGARRDPRPATRATATRPWTRSGAVHTSTIRLREVGAEDEDARRDPPSGRPRAVSSSRIGLGEPRRSPTQPVAGPPAAAGGPVPASATPRRAASSASRLPATRRAARRRRPRPGRPGAGRTRAAPTDADEPGPGARGRARWPRARGSARLEPGRPVSLSRAQRLELLRRRAGSDPWRGALGGPHAPGAVPPPRRWAYPAPGPPEARLQNLGVTAALTARAAASRPWPTRGAQAARSGGVTAGRLHRSSRPAPRAPRR